MTTQQPNIQHAAFAAPIASSWVMANAGSGKTYTLTWRVVGLLLRGVAPESIWCVTYTNAAAAEMRERLIATLKKMHVADDEALHAMLVQPLPECAAPQWFEIARSLYTEMLERTHGGVRFTTMHGLCQSLLSAFPLEAGIAESAVLLDAPASSKLRREAIRSVLGMQAEKDSPLYAALTHVAATGNFSHMLGMIEKIMGRNALQSSPFTREPEEILPDMQVLLGLEAGAGATSEMQHFLADSTLNLAPAIAAMVESKNANDQAKGGIVEAWARASAAERAALYNDYIAVFLTGKMEARKAIATKQTGAPDSPQIQLLAREQARVLAHVETLANIALAEDSAAMQLIVQAASDAYQFKKAQQSVLDYDDLLHVAHRLLTSPEMMPWIMHKLDYRLEHLLVDEAQDTSPIQWKMIHALCEEIIAQSEASAQPKTLFVVGDEKQSIYSFQGAAPHLLEGMHSQLAAMLPDGLPRETLAMSYRSSEAVLDMVNALCAEQTMASAIAQTTIAPHQLHHKDCYGRVECWPLAEGTKAEDLPPYTMPTAPITSTDADSALAADIVNQLQTRILGTPLRGKAVGAGDIIILVRTRSAFVGKMSAALMRAGIAVAGVDRLRLTEHPAVQDIMALMAWCLQPADDMALAQIMTSPLLGMSQDDVFAIAHARGEKSLWAALQQQNANAAAQLAKWQQDAHDGAYALLQRVLTRDGNAAAFSARMGHDALEVLDECLLYFHAKHEDHADNLSFMLTELQKEAPEIKREQHGDAAAGTVRIMTVHGAKGLQAPVVILADTTRPPSLQQEMVYADDDYCWAAMQPMAGYAPKWAALKEAKKHALMQEYYRLLYVATTRAEDMLVIAGAGKVSSGSWYEMARAQLLRLNPADEDGRLIYEKGAQAATPSQAAHTQPTTNMPAWLHAPVTVAPALPRLRPSYMGAEHEEITPPEAPSAGDARGYGDCFHALMEWADESTPAALIARFAVLHNQPAERLVAEFQGLWKHGEIAELLRMPARNEQDMVGTLALDDQPYQFRGQIDRLIITDDACIVLDYKTSQQPPENMPETYRLQLASYVAMLRQIYPSYEMRAALLWTATARLDWLGESELILPECAIV